MGAEDEKIYPEGLLHGIKMRDYTPDNRDSLVALYDSLCRTEEGRAALNSYFWCEGTREGFIEHIDDPAVTHRTLVVAPEGTIVGWGEYCAGGQNNTMAGLSRFVVPEAQGQGIGKKLIEHMINRCRELSPQVTEMYAITLTNNEKAVRSLRKAAEIFNGTGGPIPQSNATRYMFQVRK